MLHDHKAQEGIYYDPTHSQAPAVCQVMVSNKHSVNYAGLGWLKSLGVDKVYFVRITPAGEGHLVDDEFVAKVYHLPMEPVCPN